jgi:anthranilate synthase component 1
MQPEYFEHLCSEGYNRIPVMREVLADLDTPLSVYLKLSHLPYSYLFESVQGGEKWGRYSIIGLPARTVLKVRGYVVTLEEAGEVVEQVEVPDPLTFIEDFQQRYRVPTSEQLNSGQLNIAGLPRFFGGLVGYFGYDTIRYIEPKLAQGFHKPDTIGAPDILLMLSDEVVVFDNLRGRLQIIVHAQPGGLEVAQQRLDAIEAQLRLPLAAPQTQHRPAKVDEADFVSGFTEAGFKHAVHKAKEYIAAGDVMQVVLSQRMSIPFSAPSLDLYRALRGLNPSPYMFFLDLGDMQVVGSSPEILVRLEDEEVTVRPIAGTRRRGHDAAEDAAFEAELLADPKERAEHLMLIDLGRNDIGRVCKTGSVRLTDKMVIERYSHVMHIVSNVTGQLRDGLSAMDVLRATFPAGTVSGAPKVRAMEIIDELEPVKRGVYAGAVGYLGWGGSHGGNMDTAIAIRTAVIKDGELHIQAGAGIVYDSIPALEWKETMNKGRAIFRAVALAEAGLDASAIKHR